MRQIAVAFEDSVATHGSIGIKHWRPAYKKPLLEAKGGDTQSDDGTWATFEQVVDRRVDPAWYRKKVVKADGTVVRDVSEPLPEHTGRGSAKRTREP